MRKAEKEKETSQVKARRLVEEKTTIATKKEKAEEDIVRLRRELQDLRAGVFTQKKNLEADYKK